MLFIYGAYRFASRRVAYRQDYCLSCETERTAEQIRSFFVGHLYWVPVLPLGFFKTWHCVHCGQDPALRVRTSRPLVKVFAAVLAAVAALVTITIIVDWKNVPLMAIPVTLAIWGLAAGIWWVGTRMQKPTERAERLKALQPASTVACALCHAPLVSTLGASGPSWKCVSCDVERRVA